MSQSLYFEVYCVTYKSISLTLLSLPDFKRKSCQIGNAVESRINSLRARCLESFETVVYLVALGLLELMVG